MDQRELTPDKKDKGFTLVELLIVIVILGILATVVVFAVAGVTQKAQDNACDTTEKTLRTAIESFKAENPGMAPVFTADEDGPDVLDYLTDGWPTAQFTQADPPEGIGECEPTTTTT